MNKILKTLMLKRMCANCKLLPNCEEGKQSVADHQCYSHLFCSQPELIRRCKAAGVPV